MSRLHEMRNILNRVQSPICAPQVRPGRGAFWQEGCVELVDCLLDLAGLDQPVCMFSLCPGPI